MKVEQVTTPIEGFRAKDERFSVVSKTRKDAIRGLKAVNKLASKFGGTFPVFEDSGRGKHG